jgi:dipeptidyl aminopeptidase/acylaminoacyl peptidase
LTDALKKAGARTELFTIAGDGHGNFRRAERSAAYVTIREFLKANGL